MRVGLGVAFAAAVSVCAAQSALAQQKIKVGVLSLEGSASEKDRATASEQVLAALRGLRPIATVSLLDLEAVLGAEVSRAVAACADDTCRWEKLATLNLDRLVMGTIDRTPDELRFSLRVLGADGSTSRTSRELSGERAADLTRVIATAVTELFAEYAKESFGTLLVRSDVDGAEVFVDGERMGVTPLSPLSLSAGRHEVAAGKAGYSSFSADVEILVGQQTALDVDLEKHRSSWPLVLAGTAVVAVGTGVLLGTLADGTVSDWQTACPEGTACASGFTRQRYIDDESSVDLQTGLANGLFISGGVLAVAAVATYFWDPWAED